MRRRARSTRALVMAFMLLNGGCKSLLEVESPLRVAAAKLDNPALAAQLVNGVIGDFECAYGGYVVDAAMVTDELYGSAGIVANIQVALRREVGILSPNSLPGCSQIANQPTGQLYIPLSIARFQADDIYSRIQSFSDADVPAPGKTVLLATTAAYGGYAYTLFGEGFCRSAFDGGPELSRPQVLALAEQKFTQALTLAQAANNSDLMNFARVGRARVRLNLGRLAEAAADAKLVSSGYVKYATYSSDSPRRQNQVNIWNNGAFWTIVDPSFRNLTVNGVPDPRVPARDGGRNANDGVTRLWVQTKYPSDASSIPIASWDEAQLIIAEVEGGQSAVDRINALRTNAGLPTFSSTDPAIIAQQVREERRRQLFLQGHRLNDYLRFNLPFRTGTNTRGQLYGTMTCFPLPLAETENNPNL